MKLTKYLPWLMAAVLVPMAQAAQPEPQSLITLERERAALVTTIFSPELSMEDRNRRIDSHFRRLADIERMALRDERLLEATSHRVRYALDNYDLTFLIHASAEKQRHLIDFYLDNLGLNSQALQNSRVGTR